MKKKVKIGYVGLGRRGKFVLQECFSQMEDVEITAICDLYEERLEEGRQICIENGQKEPIATTNYSDIINNPDIDAIVLMTWWEGRPQLAMQSMLAGKYTAVEVGGAMDISECYELIDVYEKTKTPLMMLENVCYFRRKMMVLKAVKEGLFGDIVHCDGAYHHYFLDDELFLDIDKEPKHYRLNHYIHRNCEMYSTHALGPFCKILNINRGNRMLKLSSFSSKSVGLKSYAKEKFGEDSEYAKMDYKQGDIITTVITCANGETITHILDTTLPRSNGSYNFNVRGTKGMYTQEREIFYLKDKMPYGTDMNVEEILDEYDHPLMKEYYAMGPKGGHGGADWIVCRAFVESVKRGVNTPIDAYDTVLLMSIAPLSEISIARGSSSVEVPDFTKGKWMNREPIVEGKYCLDKVCVEESVKIY